MKEESFYFDLVMSFFLPKCITKLKKFYRHLVMRGKSPQMYYEGFEKAVCKNFLFILVMPLLLNQMNCEREKFKKIRSGLRIREKISHITYEEAKEVGVWLRKCMWV